MRRQCQIFVCATPGEGRCGQKGGGELLEMFKEEVKLRGIPPSTVLRNACARRHEEGPVVFVYPDDVWYAGVDREGAMRILDEHIVGGRPVDALRHVAPPGDNKLVD